MLWVIHNFSELKNFPYWGKIYRTNVLNKTTNSLLIEKRIKAIKNLAIYLLWKFFFTNDMIYIIFFQYFSLHDYYPTIYMYIDNHQFHTLIHNRSKCTNVQIPHIVIIVKSLNENKNIYNYGM